MIRPAQLNDAEPMAHLLRQIVDSGKYTILEGPVTERTQQEFIRSFPCSGVFHTAYDRSSSRLVGIQDVMRLSPETPALAHVGEISTFVDLSLRGQGIGRRLSEATFHAARRKGYRKLRASIREDNPGAVAFYRAMGFETIGLAKAHALVHGVYIDEVIAERDLT